MPDDLLEGLLYIAGSRHPACDYEETILEAIEEIKRLREIRESNKKLLKTCRQVGTELKRFAATATIAGANSTATFNERLAKVLLDSALATSPPSVSSQP